MGKRAITVNFQQRADPLNVMGGREAMDYQDWAQEYEEQLKREMAKDFLKCAKELRTVLQIEDQKARTGKIDKLQEPKLERKLVTLEKFVGVACYVEDDSELWSKALDLKENSEVGARLATRRESFI